MIKYLFLFSNNTDLQSKQVVTTPNDSEGVDIPSESSSKSSFECFSVPNAIKTSSSEKKSAKVETYWSEVFLVS